MKPNALFLLTFAALLTLPAMSSAQTQVNTPQRLIHQASGLCFTADDRGRGRGAGIELTPCDDGLDQQWVVSRSGELMNVMTRECLEPGTRRKRGQVGLGPCGQRDQTWRVVGRGGHFSLRNNQNGLCVDVAGKRGDKPVMRACDRDAEQTWSWLGIPRPRPQARTVSLVNQGLCLDVQTTPGRHSPNVALVVSCTGYASQGWTMNGRGELVNGETGQCLTAGQKTRARGRYLELAECRGKDKQEWEVRQRGPFFMLENDEYDLCLLGNGLGNEATLGKCKHAGEQASWQWVSIPPAHRPTPRPPVARPVPVPPHHPAPPHGSGGVGHRPPHRPGPQRPPRGPQAMHEELFAKVLDGMRRSSFSKDKLHAFKIGVDGQYLTCSQVARAVALVPMSKDQVKIVKQATANVIDKENREDVVRMFSFSKDQRTVRELLK